MNPYASHSKYRISDHEMNKMKTMIRHHPTLGQPGHVVDETFARWDAENNAKPERPKGQTTFKAKVE